MSYIFRIFIYIKMITMTKKTKQIIYGIEITKPFSTEMYNHNDTVATEMKANLKTILDKALKEENEDLIRKIILSFTGYGYGDGYDLQDIYNDGIYTIHNAANWQMHEEYSYLCFENLVPRTRFMMVGFDWEKHDYSYCTDKDLSPASPEIVPSGLNKE